MNNQNQKAHVLMIKKNPCPYCDRALVFFNNRNIQVEVIDLTDKPEEILAWKQKTGWATVPIIMINNKLIGGYTDLKQLDEDGQLEPLLSQPK